MTCEEENGIRLHVDRKVLRDIIQARLADGKRRSFFTIGNLFTGMGFTLVAMGSANYTASSVFVLIGLFVYMCIGGVAVEYDEGGADADEWKEPARCGHYDDEEEVYEEETEFQGLSGLSKEEKMVIFSTLFHELSGLTMGGNDVERILQTEEEEEEEGVDAEGVDANMEDSGPATPPNSESPSDAGLTIIEEEHSTPQSDEELSGPRLARAETSYSQTDAPSLDSEQPNNVEESGSATSEASAEST